MAGRCSRGRNGHLRFARWFALALLGGVGGCSGALKGAGHPAAPVVTGLVTPVSPSDTAGSAGRRGDIGFLVAESAFAVPGEPVPGARGVVWERELTVLTGHAVELVHLGTLEQATVRDSLAAWSVVAQDSLLQPFSLRRLARLYLALGDSASADSSWQELAAARTIWTWEALRSLCELALARGDTARADAILASADRRDWPDMESAEWLALRAGLRLALHDAPLALDLARQTIYRYPALPPASTALTALESTLVARGGSLNVDDARVAAEVEYYRPDRAAAARRLEGLLASADLPERWKVALRLGEMLRLSRRFPAAHDALRRGSRAAPGDAERARLWLERARVFRDADASDTARTWYARAASVSPESAVRASAWWESGQESEDAGDWSRALAAYRKTAAQGGRRRSEAWLRAGLMALVVGQRDSALALWGRANGEAARFWSAVVARRQARLGVAAVARAESSLRSLAATPGFSFYRVAARETLGIRAWPGDVRFESAGFDNPELLLAGRLAALRLGDDASLVLERWVAGDPRMNGPDSSRELRTLDRLLVASKIAFAAGRPRVALRLVERAIAALPDSADSERWSVVPWLYPPAYDSLFAAFPESAAVDAPDRALIQAVVWKESRFDARARSRSDAIGLLQLKRPAVTDVAGWLHEPAPGDSALMDPELNLRYGARYLAHQLERFPGNLPLALAAYNAGSRVAARWTRLRAIGGDALACEEIAFPETQDYVKTILAARQAYRELRPVTVRR